MPLIPYVIEKSGREERAMDIYSRLLKDRIIMLGSGVNDEVANSLVAQMLFLQSDDPKADMLINSNLTVEQSRLQDEQVQEKLAQKGEEDIVDAELVEDEDGGDDAFAEVNKVLDDTFAMLGVEG